LRAVAAGVGAVLLTSLGAGTAQATTPAVQSAHPDFVAFGSTQLAFGDATLGDYVGPMYVGLSNAGTAIDSVTGATFAGAGGNDYGVDYSDCLKVEPGSSCTVAVYFVPGALGARPATITLDDTSDTPVEVDVTGTGSTGYYEVAADGQIGSAGDAAFFGPEAPPQLNAPIVALTPTGDDGGYWLVGSDGGIYSYGDARFLGSAGGLHLNDPIVGMARTPGPTAGGSGYYMVASDGGIFAFGNATFHGSTGAMHLNQPIVGLAVTPDGGGYYLVAADGGIFAFGDAHYFGSTGSTHLNEPIVGMAVTPDGGGYWLVASDGGIFAFGDAHYYGSTGSIHLNEPIVGLAASPTGDGYWLVASDGGLFSYGDAPFYGSLAGRGVQDVVGIATDSPPTQQAGNDNPALVTHALMFRTGLRMAPISAAAAPHQARLGG
jgi:hypothetical protein